MMLHNSNPVIKKKRFLFSGLLITFFVILISRFFYLQIYKQAQYLRASENNRIREVILEPTRGLILDRRGKVLVNNHPSYSVYAIPFEFQRADTVLNLASRFLGMNVEEIQEIIRNEKTGVFSPVKLKRHVDFQTLTLIEENRLDLPGVVYQIEPKRSYPSGVRAPHLFGYLGEITREGLNSGNDKGVKYGDIVGKRGLEKVFDSELSGQRGYKYVEVDVLGRELRELKDKPEISPLPGKNLYLTIDADLQRHLEAMMDSLRGGIVVADCKNGEILAMVSKPDYHPAMFSKPVTEEIWKNIVNRPEKPLYDRMIQSMYPPGSTYKLVLAAAAIEEEIADTNRVINCDGYYRLGNKRFDCWKPEGHGRLNFLDAIEQSCNVYFYQLGLDVGLNKWIEYSKKFLFGQIVGVESVGEKTGLLPDQHYLDKHYGKNKFTKGMMLNLSIGQGDLLVTPLQMLRMVMIIANNGVYPKLHLVRYMEDPISQTKNWTSIDSLHIKGISSRTYAILKDGMYRVVNGAKGTAKSSRYGHLKAAGKTGTAENSHGEPHAWFIGFAPFNNPQIAFCVLVENGGSGGSVAAPLAKEIIRYIFERKEIDYAEL